MVDGRRSIYADSLALLTDLYELTMAYGYWKLGRAEQPAVFHLFFRRAPFRGGYAIAAGLEPVLDYLEEFRFADDDLTYLATLCGNDGRQLFDDGFLAALGKMRLSCDVDAMPEGPVAFGLEPLVRVTGPIWECQILETALLNLINFQTLVATKASRVAGAAGEDPVLEFGLRRAQGIDGGLSASRAAYVGGCAATSNVLAGKRYGIPVRGTHAHSWVMSFDDEEVAFEEYARCMPNNCVFLVDTYDTLEGVRRAIAVAQRLRARGHELVGIRLDSGDLAYLSIAARRMLDEAGFPQAAIVASNDLDEHLIESLKRQDAKISVWGVGTKLATAYDQPALGGVYKLGALQDAAGRWQPKIKLSEQSIKTTIPGILQVKRFFDDEGCICDMIEAGDGLPDPRGVIVDLHDSTRRRKVPIGEGQDLLVPVMRGGRRVTAPEPLEMARQRARQQLAALHTGVRRFLNPHEYPVGLDMGLFELRERMILAAREVPA